MITVAVAASSKRDVAAAVPVLVTAVDAGGKRKGSGESEERDEKKEGGGEMGAGPGRSVGRSVAAAVSRDAGDARQGTDGGTELRAEKGKRDR